VLIGLGSLRHGPFRQAARTAARKVLAVMPDGDAARATALASRVHFLEGDEGDEGGEDDPVVPTAFADALRADRVVRLCYRDASGAESTRDVEPLGSIGKEGQWYLVAWCRLRDEVRAFRGDRMLSVEVTEERPRSERSEPRTSRSPTGGCGPSSTTDTQRSSSGNTDRTLSRPPVKLVHTPRQLHRRNPMSFASIRIVTDDLDGLVAFYERVTGQQAERPAPVFAQFSGPGVTLAIASTATVAVLDGALLPATNRSVVIEFEVADVDAAFAALQPAREDVVLGPTTMPWGNRSALVRDPDGNVVNLFSRSAAR